MGLWNALFGKPPKTEKKEWYKDAYKPLPKYVPIRQRDCNAETDRQWTDNEIRLDMTECDSEAAKLLDLRAEVSVDNYDFDYDPCVKQMAKVKKACQGAGMAYTVLDRYTENGEYGFVETYIVQYGCERSIRPGFDGDETVPNEIVEQWLPKRRRIPQKCNHNHTMV